MSPNVGDMLESFQKLRDKIEANSVKVSSIEEACHQIAINVQQCNEYRKTLEEVSSQHKKQSRKSLIAQIRMEQRYSGALVTENSELQIAIQTHRKALDEIMGKYREQMKLLQRIQELENIHKQKSILDDSLEKRQSYLNDIHKDIPAVLSQICDKDLVLIEKQNELIARIKLENARMRRQLMTEYEDSV